MDNTPNATGFSPVPKLQSQVPRMDNSQANREWEEDNIVSNRQAQGLPSYAPAFGGAQPSYQTRTDQILSPAMAQPSAQYADRAVMPGFTSPSPASTYSPQAMFGSPSGAPIQSFGGYSNPYLNGNTPVPQTLNGGQYDRVQAIQNLQAQQAMQNAALIARARARDGSPLAFGQRLLAGLGGRPQPVSAQQRAASTIAANNGLSERNQEMLLKAIGAGQGDWKDHADLQHQLAGDYNTDANNRMNYDQQMYGHDVADRGNQLTYGSNMYGHDVTREGNQLTAANIAQRNSDLAQHEVNTDGLANRGQQISAQQNNRDFGLRKQQASIAQSNIEAQRNWEKQKAAAEQVYEAGTGGNKGIVYSKYNFPVAGPPAPPAPPTSNGSFLDPIAKFLGFAKPAVQNSALQPAPQALPQPTKANTTLDAKSAQAYLSQYGSKEAARAAATRDGWRLQ